MKTNGKYLFAVALLAVLAVAFGVFGTVAPPLAEESTPIQPLQESSSESVGHFTNPPSYDSGWVNITNKAGQYFTLRHDLNTTNVVVDTTGKQSLGPNGGVPEWNKTYGGTSGDEACSVVQTGDGGYALAGSTDSYDIGGYDFWLVKTDSSGNALWNKTYGGLEFDYATSAVQTGDGGYTIAGETYSYGVGTPNHNNVYLVKTDSDGNMVWNKTYGGTNDDYGYSVVQTSDGGYAIAGVTWSFGAGVRDFWLVKTDEFGNMEWSRTYGGANYDVAHSVVETNDGGYAIFGYTDSYGVGGYDLWLVRTDSTGTVEWNKTYGGTDHDFGFSLVKVGDGGYAIAGDTTSFGAGELENFWLIKTDSTGTVEWDKTYGGTDQEQFPSVIETNDGGYALSGSTWSFGSGYCDFWLVKTDSIGNMEWNQTYGGANYEGGYCLLQTDDGGYATAGYTISFGAGSTDSWLIKLNPDAGVEHQTNLGDTVTGLAWTGLTNYTITLHRGIGDIYWNYARVRIWLIEEPSWIYGDVNMDGVVDAKDLYIIGRNYGQTFSLLSLGGIVAVAGIHTVKKRKQNRTN